MRRALIPNKVKYRKCQRGRYKAGPQQEMFFHSENTDCRLLVPGWVKSQQIEACRGNQQIYEKKRQIMDKDFSDKPVSKKPRGQVGGEKAFQNSGLLLLNNG